jgi:hypothetical protein
VSKSCRTGGSGRIHAEEIPADAVTGIGHRHANTVAGIDERDVGRSTFRVNLTALDSRFPSLDQPFPSPITARASGASDEQLRAWRRPPATVSSAAPITRVQVDLADIRSAFR